MPQQEVWSYACKLCSEADGVRRWVSFPSEAERDQELDRHHALEHDLERMLIKYPQRWLGCDEVTCVCDQYGPPCGHRRHRGCVRCDPVKAREWRDKKAAAERMAMQLAKDM